LYWIIGRRSKLTMDNKLLLYKSILKPVWTYGIQLWGAASNSNIEILQRFQSKALRIITCAPWYMPNWIIQRDLKMKSVKDEIKEYSSNYRERLTRHPNTLAVELVNCVSTEDRRLKRNQPSDLWTSTFR
jgi:hypothetical protein